MLYIPVQHYIKTVHFWLKYNGLAIVRKTTKLIEGGHRGLHDYRHICYYFVVFLRFYAFFKIQKVSTFYVFCRVSYVFSNWSLPYLTLCYVMTYLFQFYNAVIQSTTQRLQRRPKFTRINQLEPTDAHSNF